MLGTRKGQRRGAPHAQRPAGAALFTGRMCLVQVLSAASKQDEVVVACGLSEGPSDLLRVALQRSIRGREDLWAAPEGPVPGEGCGARDQLAAALLPDALLPGALPMPSSLSGLDFASLPPLEPSLLASLGVEWAGLLGHGATPAAALSLPVSTPFGTSQAADFMAGGLRVAPPDAVAAATRGLPARTRSRGARSPAAPASEQNVSQQDPRPRRQRRRTVVHDF